MPIYYARGVSVRLGVLPLHDTITPTITLKKGDLAKRECENAEKKLLKSKLVPEERVAFPDDERDFELHWLGGKGERWSFCNLLPTTFSDYWH
jgi:hypothetical protein